MCDRRRGGAAIEPPHARGMGGGCCGHGTATVAQCAGAAHDGRPRMTLSRLASAAGLTLLVPAAAAFLNSGAAAPPKPAAPDLQALVHEARKAQRADIVAWAQYRFRRQERVEELTETGQIKSVRTFDFEITPLHDSFDERLLFLDGLAPPEAEVEEQRRNGRFAKHYRTLLAGSEEEDPESGYSISTLLRLSEYRDAGRESIDGIDCHRLDFEPQENPPGSGIEARIAEAMSGSLWLTADGAHLIRARTTSTRPVSLTLGLFKVHALEVAFDAQRVATDTWLPRQLSIASHARLVFLGQHRKRVFTYSDYAPLARAEATP